MVPPSPSLYSSLILRFHTFKPGGHRTTGGHPSAAAGFNFLPRCQPQTCPGTCPRSAPQARAASPAFLPAAPAGTAPGASAGASTPRPSVPDDAGGGQRSGPAPGEAADAAGRGCMPGQSCTSPLAYHKRLGKRRARAGRVTAPTCGHPVPVPTHAPRPSVHALVCATPGQCGPCKFTMLAVRRVHRAPRASGIPGRRGAFTRRESRAGGGGEDREVSGERNNWPRAVKTK